MNDLAFMSALEQARLIRAKDISVVELVTMYLERIARYDPLLNSYVTVAADQALDQAREAQHAIMQGREIPPFHGVPISIKDLSETAGIRTTMSSRAFANYVPKSDSPAVRQIRKAGFIILGKTNTSEFGMLPVTESELNGVCRNPWNTKLTPGGSSGGAAAALAAGLCAISHGRDGAGSIRIPASCCGLWGLKPGRGRVSQGLQFSFPEPAIDGPIARTVADAAAMLDSISQYGADDLRPATPERLFSAEVGREPGRLRVAYTACPPVHCFLDPECGRALEYVVRLLAELGHHVEEKTPDWVDTQLVSAVAIVRQTIPIAFGATDRSLLGPHAAAFSNMADQTSSAQFTESLLKIRSFARRVLSFWTDYDILVTPTLALQPVETGWLDKHEEPTAQFQDAVHFAPFPAVANFTGQPAMSVPLYRTFDGIPLGIHLIGKPAAEAQLIRLSAQLERASPQSLWPPPLVNTNDFRH